jgi:effector-binding domain-containing protein
MTTTQTPTPTTAAPPLDVREVCAPEALLLELEMRVGPTAGDMAAGMGQAFSTLMALVQDNSLSIAGPPRAIYSSWNGEGTRFTAALPIAKAPDGFVPPQDVRIVSLPEQQALRFTHHGAYAGLADTYRRIDTWLRERGAIKTDADWTRYCPMWEEYMTDPMTTPEEQLLTYIYLPLH